MSVTLTEKAEYHLRALLLNSASDSNLPTKGIRLLASSGGCNGYEYGMEITSSPKPDDVVIEQNQVLIYVDTKSAPLLEGMVIDFVEGVLESGFKFTNPNATNTCSCGKSFSAGDFTPEAKPCNN
jgi:iron-sulfur cluster assembly protein